MTRHDPPRPPDDAVAAQTCLTLVLPVSAQDRLVDWLLTHPDWRIEFSVHLVAARGPLVALTADDEQVQGYAQRIECRLIIAQARLDDLLAALQTLLRGVPWGYWATAVAQLGWFNTGGDAAAEAA